ncbi:protelomerase family protein [Coleofasciculus sp. E1-EBD-02]|uniref:protelomerase family protein n=1 Tax=Coleofasciculus sp. E1-EBD-02 TaxID=3068481 RepID=UPI003302D299
MTFYWLDQNLWGKGRQPAQWEAQLIDEALHSMEGLTRSNEDQLLQLRSRLTQQFLQHVGESSLKNCFSRLHKAIKIHFSPSSGRLTQANSVSHPTKHEPVHIALLLVDTPQEIKDKNNALHGEALEYKHSNVAYIDNPQAIIDKGRELLNKAITSHRQGDFCNYRDLGASLCLLAGLRPIEALRDAVLEPKSKFTVIMAQGQAKTRGEERTYEMPTLIEASKVLEGYSILREIFDASDLNDNEIQSYKNGVRDHVIMHFKDLVPTLQRLNGEKQVNTQRLRAVYDAIATFYYCPAKVKDFVFVKAINGHKPQKGRSDAAMHYLDYQMADNVVAQYNGKRQGVKLREPGVKVLDKFQDLVEPIRVPKNDKISQVRIYQRDRTRLQQLTETLNTPNQKDTFSIVLKLADITLRLAQQLDVEPQYIEQTISQRFQEHQESSLFSSDDLHNQPEETTETVSVDAITQLTAAITRLTDHLEQPAPAAKTSPPQPEQAPAFPSSTQREPKQRSSEASEAYVNRAIDAIMDFNNDPNRQEQDKWFIGVSPLKKITKRNQALIERVLQQREADLNQHHAQHQLTPKHNSKGRFAPKIEEVIQLES